MTLEEEIRLALGVRESAVRIIEEEDNDPKNIDPAALKAAKEVRRATNRLLARLYERDQRWERAG